MSALFRRWVAIWLHDYRERRLAASLMRLNDHHLADIGLRRDQLQPDGIRRLDLPPVPRSAPVAPTQRRRPAHAQSFQGCG